MSRWICALAFAFYTVVAGSAQAQDRPNILWLTSEDNSAHWIGCYGNEDAETPNIDRLAKNGIRYRYAYANAPVCAVARFSLITGRYACGMGTQNMRSRYPIPDDVKTYVSFMRDGGYYCVNRSKTDYNFATDDKSHWDECSNQAHWKNRPDGKPFFAVFNTTISHESCLFEAKLKASRKSGMIPEKPSREPESVQLPPFLPDTPEIREDWVTYMDVITAMDKQIGDWLTELDEAGLSENTIVIYYSDHGGVLPRAKRYVYDTGTHVPMIAHFPKKWQHLAPGPAGSVSDRPVSFIDLPPTLLSLAGLEIPEQFQGRAFLGTKTQPQEDFVFLFGQRFDARMLRFARAVTNGKYRYIRNFYPHHHNGIFTGYPHGQAGWRSFLAAKKAGQTNAAQNAFWSVPQPAEELYDLTADPWEVQNLANDPGQAARLDEMRNALLGKMREIGDTGLVPESMYNDLSAAGTVYDYVHDGAFPYDEVLNLALLAGDGQVSNLPQLQAALDNAHPVMRFWGAVGCTLLAEKSLPAGKQLARLLEDPTETVQLAAAEALFRQGEMAAALQTLQRILENTSDDIVALEALNLTSALGVTREIPHDIYARACGLSDYTKNMLEDY